MQSARGGEGERGSECVMGAKFQFGKMSRSGDDGGDGCTTV